MTLYRRFIFLLLYLLLLQSRTGFNSDPHCFFFVRSLLFPVHFSVANCAGYKVYIFGSFHPIDCNFTQDNARFHPLPLLLQSSAGCNRKQFPVAISRRKSLPFSQDTIVNLRRKHYITKTIKYKAIIQKPWRKKLKIDFKIIFFFILYCNFTQDSENWNTIPQDIVYLRDLTT